MEFLNKLSKFWIRIFILILIVIIFPLSITSLLVVLNMENIITNNMSESIVQTISRNESYLTEKLKSIAYLSDTVINDDNIREMLGDKTTSVFYNTQYLDNFLNRIDFQTNSDFLRNAKVIIFDTYGRTYTNWSKNFKDYSFLLKEPWVQDSIKVKGAITWSLFTPGYIEEDHGVKYISLARSIFRDATYGDHIGTLIISIKQDDLADLLLEYGYKGDSVAVVLHDGEILLKRGELITPDFVADLVKTFNQTDKRSIVKEIGDNNCFITKYSIPKPWTFNNQILNVIHITDYSPILKKVNEMMFNTWLILAIVLLIALILSVVISCWIVRPIKDLTEAVANYDVEHSIKDLNTVRQDEIGSLNRGVILMSVRIKNLFNKVKEESKIKEQYHYESMRANLNPHFIFNTLNTIKWMAVIRKADNISKSIEMLAKLMRYSMNKDGSTVTLNDEIDNITSYVYIHNIRYENFVVLNINISEQLRLLYTQKFILQPIIENAIIHGMDDTKGALNIYINAEVFNNHLVLYVKNDGKVISQTVIDEFEKNEKGEVLKTQKALKITGIGLDNVNSCIKIRFGIEYGITPTIMDGYTTVIYNLPVLIEGDV